MAAVILPNPLASRLVAALLERKVVSTAPEARALLLALGADLGLDADAIATAGADAAPGHDPDLTRVGEEYARVAYASTQARRHAGVYYTPPLIIDRILDLVWTRLSPGADMRSVCDPAMGCGFFFLRIIDRLGRSGMSREAVRDWSLASLHGVDRDPGAVLVARTLICLALSDPGRPVLPDPVRLRQGDSLLGPAFGESGEAGPGGLDWTDAFPEVAAAGGFGAVVGNPPYEVLTSFQRHPERRELAAALRRSGWYRYSLDGQINLYRCFIERCLRLVAPGRPLSLVVPLSLSRDGSAARLRRHLLEECNAAEWHFYQEDERLFSAATQSACVFRAVRAGGPARRVRLVASGGEETMRLREIAGLDGNRGGMPIPAIGPDDLARLRWIRDHCQASLADIAELRVGEVDQTVYRACMRDTDTGCLLARGEHLSPFRLDVDAAPGKARFLDLTLFLHMKGASATACRRRAAAERVVQLGIRNMQSSPRLVAALAPAGVYLGNSLNVYYPRGVAAQFLAALLNSRLLDWLFRLTSGNNNINLREMAILPIPTADPDPVQRRALADAYQGCVQAAGNAPALDDARHTLNRAVESYYKLPSIFSLQG